MYDAKVHIEALVGEYAAAEKRLSYVRTLLPMGAKIWGDMGWRVLGRAYMGAAGYKKEVPNIYRASDINIDINRIYQSEIVTMRVFDVLACGGFVFAEYAEDLETLFRIDEEIVVYRTQKELLQKPLLK